MRSFPSLPVVTGPHAPDDLLDGHLWILELIDGTGLRFRMDESGLLRFGGPDATYADDEDVPLALRPAVRHVREAFDREALRAAVDDPEGVTFLGVATHRRGTNYDWDRLPPFLGTDVYSADADAFRPPDAVAAIFDGVGVTAVNAVEREVHARDFDPTDYAIPESAWRDGPAAGVDVRNKRGGRGKIAGDGCGRGTAEDEETDAATDGNALAETHATPERFDRVVAVLDRRGDPVTVDELADRTVESIARETTVSVGDGNGVDTEALRVAVVERARAYLDERTEEW
ncbi:hypothetical protein [Halorubrum laminariae]|uniref:RNA ligase domain-containing protein n=1 Tax=Halorubrum laminariae TaxID=1433523 RepID=A0ABD6BWN7_9EURY|nr:hypothetical protein [Halorubrum laminariae]